MERLIAVALGDRDPILHALRVRRIAVTHKGVCQPALLLLHIVWAVDYYAYGEDIVDTLEWSVLFAHLSPYRVYRFGATLDVVLNTCRIEASTQRCDKLLDKGFALSLTIG